MRTNEPSPTAVRRAATSELTAPDVIEIRELLRVAFGDDEDERFTDEDWAHALGGVHVLVEDGGAIVAHGSVVERAIEIDGRPIRTGYVEAVATRQDRQGQGVGTRLMTEIAIVIRERYELGMLGTGSHHFYERLGWRTWHGPSSVRTDLGPRRTPDEDGYLLVLTTPSSPPFELTEPISCEWRPGDVW